MTLDQVQEALATLPENEVFLLGVVMCTSSGVHYAVVELGNEATDQEAAENDELLELLYECEANVLSTQALFSLEASSLIAKMLIVVSAFGVLPQHEIETIFGATELSEEDRVEYAEFEVSHEKERIVGFNNLFSECIVKTLPPCDAVVSFGLFM